MSTFRSFQTGLMAGQQQAKVKREDDARVKAAESFGKGNYEGASASLLGVGLMDEADAYTKAGERKVEAERTKTYADAFKTGLGAGPAPNKRGGYEALGAAAAGQGDIDMMTQVDKAIAGMDEQQAEQLKQGMEFLGQTALGLKNVPPEMRGEAAIEILSNSPFGNEQVLGMIQQAQADGRITDEELDNFAMQTMSVADRVKSAQAAATATATAEHRSRQLAETTRHNQAMEQRQPGNGISVTMDENGRPVVQIGGPAQDGSQLTGPTKPEETYYKSLGSYETGKAQRNTMLNNIGKAKQLVNAWTTGIGGAFMKNIPGSEAVNLNERLKTVKALIGFQQLQQMRDNSPTGGALGQVTEKELGFLQAVEGSLDTIQSEQQLLEVIKEVEASIMRLAAAQDEAFRLQYQALKPGETRDQPRVDDSGKVQRFEGMSSADLKKRADELRAKAGGQ